MNHNSEIGENQSLVDDLNSNWSRIPKKYDDFLDLYRPAFNEEEDEETQQSTLENEAKKEHLRSALKYAMTFKQDSTGIFNCEDDPSRPLYTLALDEKFKAQTITVNNANGLDVKNHRIANLSSTLDVTIGALEELMGSLNQPQVEQNRKNQELLIHIKKDFVKHQRILTGVIQDVFKPDHEYGSTILSLLLEIHFENPEKYLIIQDIDDEVVQKLIEFFLVDIHPEDPQQIKLRQIL